MRNTRKIKREESNGGNTSLVQTSIFDSLQNLKVLSQKQEEHRKFKSMTSSLLAFDTEEIACDGEHFQTVVEKRNLPFYLGETDEEDHGPQITTKRTSSTKLFYTKNYRITKTLPMQANVYNHGKKLVVNKPNSVKNNNNLSINNASTSKNLNILQNTVILPSNANAKCKASNLKNRNVSAPIKEDKGFGSCQLKSPLISNSDAQTLTEDNSKASSPKEPPSTPEKHKSKIQPIWSSPKKRKLEYSPKKEKSVSKKHLLQINDLFTLVYKNPYSKNILMEEQQLLKNFFRAPPEYQYICLKLYTRQQRWYNIFKFCNTHLNMEDHEVNDLYNFLQSHSFVDTDYSGEELVYLLTLLDKADLKAIYYRFRLNNNMKTKKNMIETLMNCCNTQSTLTYTKSIKDLLFEEVKNKMGKSVKVRQDFQEAFRRVYLMGTFVNPDFININDFFKIIFVDRTSFPEFHYNRDYLSTIFLNRDEFLDYVRSIKYKEDLEAAISKNNCLEIFRNADEIFSNIKALSKNHNNQTRYKDVPHLKRFSAAWVYTSCISKAVEKLQAKYPNDVKTWLEYLIRGEGTSHRLGDWYRQLSWIYKQHLKPTNTEYSAKLIIEALREHKQHFSEVQLYRLAEVGDKVKIGNRYGKLDQLYHDYLVELAPPPPIKEDFPQRIIDAVTKRDNTTGQKRWYILRDSNNDYLVNVENVALIHYKNELGYASGIHCESAIIKATFALYFWDIIYGLQIEVPGTFMSQWQTLPLDFYTIYFYSNRRDIIVKRLKELESSWTDNETIEFAKENWIKHSHESTLCNIGSIIPDVNFLESVILCIGRKVLAKIFERFVKNIRQYGAGMPDLLLWDIKTKKSKFVEVKGENDKLSIAQKLWLNYLHSLGADVEVCHVHSMGSKRKHTKKKCELSGLSTLPDAQ